MELSKLPYIYVDLKQPGDKGDFYVDVFDAETDTKIVSNRLKEELSYLEYAYTSRLIEGGGMGQFIRNEELAEQQRKQRQEDLVRYGQRLYSELFSDKNTFKTYLQKQEHLAQGARIVIRLHSTASELWNIPWEYMHDGEQFLAVQAKYPIVRRLIDTKLEGNIPDVRQIPTPLRILVVISNPQDAVPLNVDAEITMMQNAVQDAEEQGLLEIDFIEEGTLENLQHALREGEYHILHYSGHGAISPKGSFLVLEDEHGLSQPVYLDELQPLLDESSDLRFVFLSACKAGNISETEATSGIATGLLTKVPSVLAMQYTIRDDRASTLSEAFYGNLGKGATLEEALHIARAAMYESSTELSDWGVPVLYTQIPDIRLLDHAASAAASKRIQFNLDTLPASSPFVGRQVERRAIRNMILNEDLSSVYLWGMAGIGKSGLVRQILTRPGRKGAIEDILVLRCDKQSAGEVIQMFMQWVQKHFPETQKIFETKAPFIKKLKALTKIIQDKRLVLVFDSFNSLLSDLDKGKWDFERQDLGDVFRFFATANWSIRTIFTSRFRWASLDDFKYERHVEIHLDSLTLIDVRFFFQQLTHLRKVEGQAINKFFGNVGGHPLTLKLVDQYLSSTEKEIAIDSLRMTRKLTGLWEKAITGYLFAKLNQDELEALRVLCIHRDNFNVQHVQSLVDLKEESSAETIIQTWTSLSLASYVYHDNNELAWYRIPQLVRTYVTNQLDEATQVDYHGRVADVVQESLYKDAELRFEGAGGAEPDPNNKFQSVIAHLPFVYKRVSLPMLDRYFNLSYAWYEHLKEAGRHKEAVTVALAIMPPCRIFDVKELWDELLVWLGDNTEKNSKETVQLSYWRAVRTLDSKEFDKASDLFKLTLDACKKQGMTEIAMLCRERQAEIDRNHGRLNAAIKTWQNVIDHYRKTQRFAEASHAFLQLGEVAYFTQDPLVAVNYIDEGMKFGNEAAAEMDVRVYVQLVLYRGHLFRKTRNDHAALQYYREALRISESLADPLLIGKSFENIGYVYGLLNMADTGARYIIQAIHLYENLGNQQPLVTALARLAYMYSLLGNRRDADVFAERAQTIVKETNPDAAAKIESLTSRVRRKKIIGF